jgi:hypothetical protein
MDKESGTGGFIFYAETTLPVLRDLNSEQVQIDLGIDTTLRFVQMRKSQGDDASCLNLNRVSRPRILGVQPGDLKGRFSMVKALPMVDAQQPWEALEKDLPGGVVPAIADQTVILWGLGKEVGDTLNYVDGFGRSMTLKLVAGLANSVFQGNVLIDEDKFIEHFPASSGTHVLLMEGVPEQKHLYADVLQRVFRSEGLDLTDAADRLAQFNSVENTYLSIFLMLGGLGMILGAVGLGIALARNILDRRQELALLKSMGFTTASILGILAREHMLLLGLGTFAGTATAIIATLPSILSDYVQASWQTALFIVLLIVLNGLFWVLYIANRYVRQNLLEALRSE